MDRTPVIVGIGLSDYPVAPHLDGVQHHVLAAQRAIADCGVDKSDDRRLRQRRRCRRHDARRRGHDGRVPPHRAPLPRRHHDGRLVASSSTSSTRPRRSATGWRHDPRHVRLQPVEPDGPRLGTGGFQRGGQQVGGPLQYEAPYGNSLVGSYAMHALRHMHEFGTTSEQLAEIAVGVREYATLNPNAMYRDPITVDDVVDSRMIADPLHKLDCCAITDGGGAFIMTTAERAADLAQPPVYVLGAAGGADPLEHLPADGLHVVARVRRRGPRRWPGRASRTTTSTC